jgi:hypothetical protein
MIAAAEDSIRAARAKGAATDEKAAPFLISAERQLAAGKASLNQGDDRAATWLIARASADGELSHAMAERARQEEAARLTESQLTQTRAESAGTPAPAEPASP